MTDQEQERPLTRRELRLRQQAEEAAAQHQQGDASDEPAPIVEESDDRSAAEELVSEIEISPFNDDGTPRSRREIRELREAAIAELLGTTESSGDDQADPHLAEEPAPEQPVVDDSAHEEPVAEPASDVSEDDDSHDASAADESVEDAAVDDGDAYGVPTEAFTLDELREAEAAADQHDDPEPTEALSLEDLFDGEEVSEPVDNADSVAALFSEDDVEAGDAEEAVVPAPFVDEDASEPAADAVDTPAEPAPASDTESDESSADAEDAPDDSAAPESSEQPSGYSFPDIQPPEEWRSVFDDPTRGPTPAVESTGDFDDLISRAVAQEGSTGSAGASALILPSHPEDTGGIAGPLGATGELFVTGSIELPKSLGETGGHAALHDSIEMEPFLTGEKPAAIGQPTSGGPTPVSALSAVSARRRPEIPVVAEPTKDRSKLPIILALTGGGLLVLLAGAAVYAASQGLFG